MFERMILFYLFAAGVFIMIIFNLRYSNIEPHFETLAKSFNQGQLSLPGSYKDWLDASYFKGSVYWPQGFFPAVLFVPFLFFQIPIHQGTFQIVLNIINLYLLYKIALKLTADKKVSLWLSFGYVFATAYLAVGFIPWSWEFAQVVATAALLSAIYEFLYKRRWLLIGVFIGCALATRIDLVLAVFFFLYIIIFSKQKVKSKITDAIFLLMPILFSILLVVFYNFFRFGSFLEFGYSYHIPALVTAREVFKQHGVWSFFYYPTNFYYLFLKGLDAVYLPSTKYLVFPYVKPDIWGMSIVLTSPIFLWCLKAERKDVIVQSASITTLLLLIFILGYFGVGTMQYGYRYALDFSPFLFLILCQVYQKGMSRTAKTVIFFSFLFNLSFFSLIFLKN